MALLALQSAGCGPERARNREFQTTGTGTYQAISERIRERTGGRKRGAKPRAAGLHFDRRPARAGLGRALIEPGDHGSPRPRLPPGLPACREDPGRARAKLRQSAAPVHRLAHRRIGGSEAQNPSPSPSIAIAFGMDGERRKPAAGATSGERQEPKVLRLASITRHKRPPRRLPSEVPTMLRTAGRCGSNAALALPRANPPTFCEIDS